MKKVKLHLYNYGVIRRVADFEKGYDAFTCMKALNDKEIQSHGYLPDNIFYYVSAVSEVTGNEHFFVEYTGCTLLNTKYTHKVKTAMYVNGTI